jgi:hypothetical protein
MKHSKLLFKDQLRPDLINRLFCKPWVCVKTPHRCYVSKVLTLPV